MKDYSNLQNLYKQHTPGYPENSSSIGRESRNIFEGTRAPREPSYLSKYRLMRTHLQTHQRKLTAAQMTMERGDAARITPFLYLGNSIDASNEKFLEMHRVTTVINATKDVPNSYLPGITYYRVPVEDNSSEDIKNYFDVVSDVIHSVTREGGIILLHCAAGVSRSVTLCIAYLMKYHQKNLYEACKLVKNKQPRTYPNRGFWRQLRDYEKEIYGSNSVSLSRRKSSLLMMPGVIKPPHRRSYYRYYDPD